MARDKTFDLLRDALVQPGCALCRLERDHVQRYLAGFMYEDVTDVDLRAKMRAAQGFCREHCAQAIRVRDSLGLAIIYQDILSTVREDMQAALAAPRLPGRNLLRRAPSPGKQAAQRITARSACPACAVRDEITVAALASLLRNINDSALLPVFRQSGALCLPHLRRALAQVTNAAALDTLVERQQEVMAQLDAELAEFIRKHDYRFRHEPMGDERDCWKRAIDMAVGLPAEEGS